MQKTRGQKEKLDEEKKKLVKIELKMKLLKKEGRKLKI
jgi:hypothetical protein